MSGQIVCGLAPFTTTSNPSKIAPVVGGRTAISLDFVTDRVEDPDKRF
jgi:hypothetical protein